MKSSTIAGRWSWYSEERTSNPVKDALTSISITHRSLENSQLAHRDEVVEISLMEYGNLDGVLLRERIRASDLANDELVASHVSGLVSRVDAQQLGWVDAHFEPKSKILYANQTKTLSNAFRARVTARSEYCITYLSTNCDAWLPYDFQGKEQRTIYCLNAPRLNAVLTRLSTELPGEMEPDDSTSFAIPTEQGLRNHFEEDGTPRDVWSAYEIPSRNSVFRDTPPFDELAYKRKAEGSINAWTVSSGEQTLGFLWCSDEEGAASFDPVEKSGEFGYQVGLMLLEHLRLAKHRNLLPSQAVVEIVENIELPVVQMAPLPSVRTRRQIFDLLS